MDDVGQAVGREVGQTVERRERREAVVLEHMQSENEHRFDDTMATFSPDSIRYELIASGAVYEGDHAVRDYWRKGRTMFPDQRNELIAMHHADDAVIIEFWLRGTHLGSLDGSEPTGRRFKQRMTAFFLFDGDAITCERVYYDTAQIALQLSGVEVVDAEDGPSRMSHGA